MSLRRTRAAADPDAPPRPVALPVAWEDGAATALAALAPGQAPVSLPRLAENWIARALARGRKAGIVGEAEAPILAEGWRALLLHRRGCPGAEAWRPDAKAEPRFVLSLPAFLEAEGGFDLVVERPVGDEVAAWLAQHAALLTGVSVVGSWAAGTGDATGIGLAGGSGTRSAAC